ncbi:hypothetical protein KC316_g1300 [Hortaea werneckii]|nr:hypothetical protein KC324_g1290 [Hortaea werneckii]KAI7594148.1 hypothetical protein KC316_g1300 [Hortaea werneckii]
MAFAFFIFALWATAVATSGCDIPGEGGPGFGPGERGSDVERAIMEASQHPNATNEVSFQLMRPGASAVDQNNASMQWSWRVNISEINFGSLPTNPGELHYPGNAADFHFVNAVNSLSWPGGGELSDELVRVTGNASGDAGRLCVTLFDLPDLPVNITNPSTTQATTAIART